MLCWIASSSYYFCDNEHQCHGPQHHKYVLYSFRRPNGSYGVKYQNTCKERTSLLFPASKRHLCSLRHSPLLQLAAERPSLRSVSIHHHPRDHVDLTHTAQDHGSSVESAACVCKVLIPRQGPYSQGLSEDAENLRFYYSISHTYLSRLTAGKQELKMTDVLSFRASCPFVVGLILFCRDQLCLYH